MTTRRSLLRWAGVAGLAVAAPTAALGGYVWATAGRGNVGRVRFERRLLIPPLARPRREPTGALGFDLRLQTGSTELLPGRHSRTWGVNGGHLGPTLRLPRGEVVSPVVRNDLPEPTTLHWHGMELPAVADGGPHQMIPPGGTWRPSWRVDQPAATLWYHPHPHGATRDHVYRGVAGLILVDDDQPTGLPQEYGVDDVPLVLQDKNIAEDGTLEFDGIDFGGVNIVGLLGSEILVNGTWGPVLPVSTELVRLRVLNGSNARVYDLAFHDHRAFHLVAADAGLLPAPVEVDHVLLSPGERVELVLRVRPGERPLLRSRPPDLGTHALYDRLAGGDDEFEIVQLVAADRLRPSPALPDRLPAAAPISADPGNERRFGLGDFTINGATMDPDRIDFSVPLGVTERWRIHNVQGVPHNFHIHNAAFEVTDVDGRPPPPGLAGRKDTVYVPPGSVVGLAVSFGQHPDPRGPYMFHCHLLAHEDAGMMGQFVVIGPGTEDQVRAPGTAASPHTGGHR
ncbi:multicopper oxidase family protein [Plantactinospora sp. CA-290183]|uniref:multicopper oxidase family protein n=1 Tax=Plantactinospora sp. CA-290183 TaxID=3240006 RepID=UPI003D8BAE51